MFFSQFYAASQHRLLKKKKVKYTKKVKRQISTENVYPGDVPKHTLTQIVRIASATSPDPDFGSSENWEYYHVDSVAGNGTHRGYTVCIYKNGDKTFVKWEGTHKTTVKEGGVWEVSYEGKYQFTGGTGKFKNIEGEGVYKGTRTAKGVAEEGEAEVEY